MNKLPVELIYLINTYSNNSFFGHLFSISEEECTFTLHIDYLTSSSEQAKKIRNLVKYCNLTKLFCSSTRIKEIPKELVNLTVLCCNCTVVKKIPKELVNLTILSFHGSKVKEIPKEFVNLEKIICDNTWIEKIPDELINLKFLGCRHTSIKVFPNEIRLI